MTRDDWIRAARLALLRGGVAAVRIERLAADLGVTKGSFYWHFAGRAQLLEALLAEWEDEADLLIAAIGAPRRQGLPALAAQLTRNVLASERGEAPSDAAIFAWAAVDPAIAQRVADAEEERLGLLARLMGDRDRAEVAYMAYLGYILRRRHAPDAERRFALLADLFLAPGSEAGAEAGSAAHLAASFDEKDGGDHA